MNKIPPQEAAEKTLGEVIREIRLQKSMSMRDFASRAKLKSVAFIADVERGFRNPSSEVLANMADALGVPVSRLRGYDHRAPVQEIRTITEQDPQWAMAFREVVDLAGRGMTPKVLINLLREADKTADKQEKFQGMP